DVQGEGDQVVPGGFDGAEIESLDRDDPCVEQGSVGVLISDREVVDPDEPDPHLDEQAGARAVEPDEVAGEVVAIPEQAVASLQEHALGAGRDAGGGEREAVDRAFDGGAVGNVGPTHEWLERQLFCCGAALEEVEGSIDVGARVDTQLEAGYIRGVAARYGENAVEMDAGIAIV